MKRKELYLWCGLALIACAVTAAELSAQGSPAAPAKHQQYRVTVLPPDGGPDSFLAGYLFYAPMNNRGTVGIAADMSTGPFYNSYSWEAGKQIDFQALPQLPNSTGTGTYINWLNQFGFAAGYAARVDASTGATVHNAVAWAPDGKIFELSTPAGAQSHAVWLNDFGLMSGWIETGTDTCSFGTGGQTEGVLWLLGMMRPLGTLGGAQSYGEFTNDLGQISGHAETSNISNATTGCPPYDPFIWQNGKMIDINPGNFGGAEGGTNYLNNQGQAVGFGTEYGEVIAHAFLWQDGKLTELDTIGNSGGSLNSAYGVSDLGHVIGVSSVTGDAYFHAVLWANGKFTDLGSLSGDGCSEPFSINAHDQIVGISATCDFQTIHAAIWENGELLDLNTLIPAGSGLELTSANWITDSGEIAAQAFDTATGDFRAVLLTPAGECETDTQAVKLSSASATVPTPSAAEAARTMIQRTAAGTGRRSAQQSLLRPYRPVLLAPERRK